MDVIMTCASCYAEMEPREGGGWTRQCGCTTNRYWCTLPPLPADAQAFYQLTGGPVPMVRNEDAPDAPSWWRY